MKLGIYGGTYNPVHNGHISAAIDVCNMLGLDRLIMIPTGTPPHKTVEDGSPTAMQRLDMLKLAIKCDSRLEVSDIEIKRKGKSYTVDTLRALREIYPNDEIYLLIGTDMLRIFDEWYNFKEILNMTTLVVLARGENQSEEIYEFSENLRKKYSASVIIADNKIVEISSSEIREMLTKRSGRDYLNDEVYQYIIENHLYRAKAEFDWLRVKSHAMLKAKRVPHVKGCEEEAVKLAERWGADVDKAREAAILHDCTKKLTLEEQLKLCREYGITGDEVEMNSEKLLHSKTGAETARRLFNVCDDVYNAILWHTTGKEDMSLLEKIIYMADYIEPTRQFDGVEKLRMLAYEDLDAAMMLGFEMSIEDMLANGVVPHERSAAALKYLRAERKKDIF